MKYLVTIIILQILFVLFAFSQDVEKSTEQIIADIFEQYIAETDENIDYETFYEKLLNLSKQPININNCSKEELEQIPFLSGIQIENILFYIYKFGLLNSVYELQLIDGIDMTDIYRLLPFISIGYKTNKQTAFYWKDLLEHGDHRIYFRTDKDIESKAGYTSENANSKYLGSSIYTNIKYRYHFSDRVQIGFTTEKDAGEPVFTKKIKTNDFNSGYVLLENIGKLKRFVVGDYKANFGLGLIMQSGFGTGKSSYVLNVLPYNQGLNKSGSTDEFNFFRGVGVTLKFKDMEFSGFYSNKMVDADTTGGTFSSFYKTGLHRSENELNKKHTVNMQMAGTNITFSKGNLKLGFTTVYTSLSCSMIPETTHYNLFRFSGKEQVSAGINYRFRVEKLNFFGESAITNKSAIATLNGMMFSPVSTVSLVMLYRYYPKEYDAFYSGAFSESTRTSNESGLYTGLEIYPFKKWKFSVYADTYSFPWTRFNSATPTVGADYLLQAEFRPKKDLSMLWRFRYENGMKNQSDSDFVMPFITPFEKSGMRFQLNFNTGNFDLKTQVEGNLYRENSGSVKYGVSALQDICYNFEHLPLNVDFRYQMFDISDYENRIYTYENDILYAFSIPAMYGGGSRYYINLKWIIIKNLSLWLKFSQTIYADGCDFTGSGNDQTPGNKRTEIKFMLSYSF
jgi:hypothetical protein